MRGVAAVPRKEMEEDFRERARRMLFSAEVVESFLGSATLSQIRCVDGMLAHELETRATRKRERLMRKARFPSPKSFDGYDFSQVTFPDGYGIDDLKALTFIGANEGFVFHGKTGRGKSHLATAVGIAAIDAGMAARFFTAAQLVMMLAKANRAGLLDVQMKDIAKSDLVILDEFGYVPLDIEGARLLFQFVSDCYERRSLILTTNIEFSKWGTVLGDDKLAAAMIDRVVHHSRLVEFNGTSHRMDAALMLGKV